MAQLRRLTSGQTIHKREAIEVWSIEPAFLDELADKLEVSRQTVNAIETERYDPSLPLAFAIAKLFGKPIEKIFSVSAKD